MGDSSPSDTILGSPSNDQRCTKNDGKFWRCSMWKMQDKSICQKHFLKQVEYKNKKKNMPPQHQKNPIKRKTHITNDDVDKNKYKKNKKKKEKEEENKNTSSGDDSIDKLFEDNYPSEKDESGDSIDELFEDNYTSCSSDVDSCALVSRPRSKVNTMSPRAKEEPAENPGMNQETAAESTTGRIK